MIVAFKGSSNFNDFIADINFAQVDFTHIENKYKKYQIKLPGKVHRGGYRILFENNRYLHVLSKIKEITDSQNIDSVLVTGHSLGGLTGTIFFAFLKELYHQNDLQTKKINLKLVTFGCPRVGNRAFRDSISQADSLRIVNKGDPVTKVPFPIYYSHVPLKLKIGKKSADYSIKNHSITEYFQNLLEAEL